MKNDVKKIRKQLGLTQKSLAEAIEISRPYLSEIENDKSEPSGKLVIRIAKYLNLPVESIFFV